MADKREIKTGQEASDGGPVPIDPTVNPNRSWKVIAVLGRPSACKKDFFNSIKFHEAIVQAASRAEALDLGDPFTTGADLSDGYEVLNWYAFDDRGGTV